ncbi:hypothetical protein GOP47_0024665 [Adiantum capillus-veneris]|uniref:Uncharacterized protein n=1 Tax=Adiantum capillus-veneris TaxID=13818 RepID=A0A9D4U2J6_ADICA|nr:hypothetical protein GOP47_0024665 [Adiantum capillus-veneris]
MQPSRKRAFVGEPDDDFPWQPYDPVTPWLRSPSPSHPVGITYVSQVPPREMAEAIIALRPNPPSTPQERAIEVERKQRELEERQRLATLSPQLPHDFFDALRARPPFTKEDFPKEKPPPQDTGGRNYSQKHYEEFLKIMCRYSSWKEYVVKSALQHWHPGMDFFKLIRIISFLPGRGPPPSAPPQSRPRRSMRLFLAKNADSTSRWSESDESK